MVYSLLCLLSVVALEAGPEYRPISLPRIVASDSGLSALALARTPLERGATSVEGTVLSFERGRLKEAARFVCPMLPRFAVVSDAGGAALLGDTVAVGGELVLWHYEPGAQQGRRLDLLKSASVDSLTAPDSALGAFDWAAAGLSYRFARDGAALVVSSKGKRDFEIDLRTGLVTLSTRRR